MKILRREASPSGKGEILLIEFRRSDRQKEYITCLQSTGSKNYLERYFSEYEAAFGDFERRLSE